MDGWRRGADPKRGMASLPSPPPFKKSEQTVVHCRRGTPKPLLILKLSQILTISIRITSRINKNG